MAMHEIPLHSIPFEFCDCWLIAVLKQNGFTILNVCHAEC